MKSYKELENELTHTQQQLESVKRDLEQARASERLAQRVATKLKGERKTLQNDLVKVFVCVQRNERHKANVLIHMIQQGLKKT